MVITTLRTGPGLVGSCPPTHLTPTHLISREPEITEIKRLLTTNRLLTLTGMGGSGKTCLAYLVTTHLSAEFDHDIWWVELATLTDPLLVPQAVAQAIGIDEHTGGSLMERLLAYFKSSRALLVLDNCEHLIEACARLVETLLHACPSLRVLSTSREGLHIPGETMWLNPPLHFPCTAQLPPLEDLMRYEAVQFFVERAKAVLPTFAVTAENAEAVVFLCQRLEGNPLAIELAATHLHMASVEQIITRLDNCCQLLINRKRIVSSRHQNIYATIDWSYVLLSEKERLLFRRLAVFRSSFGLDMAEAICTGPRSGINEEEILSLLSCLVDKSLVVIDKEARAIRYRLPEPIRQYAQARLQEAGEHTSMYRAHRNWYLKLVTMAASDMTGAQRRRWFEVLRREESNLNAALRWTFEQEELEILVQFAQGLWRFWLMCGPVSEGRWLLEWIIARLSESTAERAWVLYAASMFALYQHDYKAAHTWLDECSRIWKLLEDREKLARVLLAQGNLAFALSDYQGAAACYRASLTIFQTSGMSQGVALACVCLENMESSDGSELERERLRLLREQGDPLSFATVLEQRALLASKRDKYSDAVALYEESLALRRLEGDRGGCASLLMRCGHLAVQQGNLSYALACYKESLKLFQKVGDRAGCARVLLELAGIARMRGRTTYADKFEQAGLFLCRPAPLGSTVYGRGRVFRTDWTTFVEAWGEDCPPSLEDALTHIFSDVESAKQLSAPLIPVATTKTRPSLRLFAFGSERVYCEQHLLAAADWKYVKAKELLFYLLFHCPKRREQIGLVLWPDASSDQLRNNFHTTLYNLRRALGRPDWILFEDGLYTFNRKLSYWCDVEAFDALLSQAAKQPENAVHCLQKAAKIYRGDLLEDVLDSDWHLALRRELRKKYLEGLFTLGQHLFDKDEYAQAADTYRQLITHDSYLEAAHCELMRCYVRQGEVSQAMRHFQDFVQMVRDELGASPARKTIALFESIRRGETV